MPTILLFILSLATCRAPQGQDPPPQPPPFPGKESPAKPVDPAAADPGAPKPGELPAAASTEARSAWERVCRASLVPDAEHAPVRGFELALDVRPRKSSGGTNDFKAEFRFLQPGWVRVKTVEGNREVGRGPDGDWLFDGARGEKVALSVGREFAEDRRQLDEWAAVARIFVSLTDPSTLRLATLELLRTAPPTLPARLAKRSSELAWLLVRSPDFRLVGANPATKVFRASLGWDPKTGRVELALVEEDDPTGQLKASAKLVEMQQPTPSGGFVIPKQLFVYSIEEGQVPPSFAVPAGLDLVVKSSNLRAQLQPEDFKLR